MRILFDHGTPAPLRRHLANHSVTLAKEMGWSRLVNGELLKRAENEGFDLLLTTGRNLGYQQNLTGRKSNRWATQHYSLEGFLEGYPAARPE
jgi:hypothetical protein